MVELDHPFSTARPIDEAWQAILDLERLVPCVEGGSVIEKTGPEAPGRLRPDEAQGGRPVHPRSGHLRRSRAAAGTLHGAVLRSPLAHSRIVSIDASAALAHPKVHLVLTGKDLEARDLAWMPTMSGDTQAVLAAQRSAAIDHHRRRLDDRGSAHARG